MRGMPAIRSTMSCRGAGPRAGLGMALVCLVAGACAGSTATQVTAPTVPATQGPDQAPSAPTAFYATFEVNSVDCPGEPADPDDPWTCRPVTLEWESTNTPETSFRIYDAWTGEGDPMPTCADISSDEIQPLMDSGPGDRQATHYQHLGGVGGGEECFWISAFNAAGESRLLLAASNWDSLRDPEEEDTDMP
jgi:hypothetical protein